jgi:hypothetical protein
MTRFTVQCAYAAYYSATATVDADTLDDALDAAVQAANETSAWSSSDHSGATFVEAIAQGDDVDLWLDKAVCQLPIPARFTERGDPQS